ncbi:MAG TPA: erythromycin esterase family protein, partial [Pyrinomonadaceae bacterium]|nr:erythromycin esterase family protein [Pyrinomonadaceae bacterium]
MVTETTVMLTDVVREAAHPLTGEVEDYNPLMDLIGDASLVLIGEASHGTHEFYRERAQITKRLIKEKGFTAVAVEADWPDAYRVNRYVQSRGIDADAVDALAGFKRFPAWMWRNADVLDFVGWLRTHNDDLPASATKVGFYGLDLYSLHTSISVVLDYLERIDPEAARRARTRYACFDHFGKDEQAYGYATGLGLSHSCEAEVISQLVELYKNTSVYALRDGRFAKDEHFYVTQNARLVMNAERYYRSMFRGRVLSWNLRDAHMAETLAALQTFLCTQRSRPKIVVWEHNSHL